MRIIAALAVFLAFTPALRADVFELDFSVIVGDFKGYWRFADQAEGDTIGTYSCGEPLLASATGSQMVRWYTSDCTVTIKPVSQDTAQTITFEILALHGVTTLEISGSKKLAFPLLAPGTPTISLAPDDTGGTVTINSVNIMVEPNGFVGPCGFEAIINDQGQNRNSCDGSPTALARGTTVQLFAAGRDANPVHISHLGIPYAEGNGRVYRINASTIGFRTVDVRITPSHAVAWDLEGIPRSNVPMPEPSGPDTLRLVQDNAYHLRANPQDQTSARGTVFTLYDRCGAPAQRVFIPDYGVFFVEQLCGTERP